MIKNEYLNVLKKKLIESSKELRILNGYYFQQANELNYTAANMKM